MEGCRYRYIRVGPSVHGPLEDGVGQPLHLPSFYTEDTLFSDGQGADSSYLSGTLLPEAEVVVGRRAAFAIYTPLPSKYALRSWLSTHERIDCGYHLDCLPAHWKQAWARLRNSHVS